MTIEEAMQDAEAWTRGQTFYEGQTGWRPVVAVLAAEVRRLREAITEYLDAYSELNNADDWDTRDQWRIVLAIRGMREALQQAGGE